MLTLAIDSHQHFWNDNPIELSWMPDDMATLRRSFLPSDLQPFMTQTGVDGVVTVQARQMIEETDWLLELAAQYDFIKGIVGWLPLSAPDVEVQLDRYAGHTQLKGLRHVVEGEPDGFILGRDFNRGVSLLKSRNLVYDILIFEHQLADAIHFVDQHPEQVFVLDHIVKPAMSQHRMEPWSTHIRELAKREHVYCKLSGMTTEADFNPEAGLNSWTPEQLQLQLYYTIVLDAFTPDRLMFGSDWPVCLIECGYQQWHQLVSQMIASLSQDERAAIMGGNAIKVYHLYTSLK